jgi:hypothetical protein
MSYKWNQQFPFWLFCHSESFLDTYLPYSKQIRIRKLKTRFLLNDKKAKAEIAEVEQNNCINHSKSIVYKFIS